jgi:hypothetical protein
MIDNRSPKDPISTVIEAAVDAVKAAPDMPAEYSVSSHSAGLLAAAMVVVFSAGAKVKLSHRQRVDAAQAALTAVAETIKAEIGGCN